MKDLDDWFLSWKLLDYQSSIKQESKRYKLFIDPRFVRNVLTFSETKRLFPCLNVYFLNLVQLTELFFIEDSMGRRVHP